ncbi:hypothetical protein FA95DRAFT_1683907 [Auriscalpium vulgare]|uniref:Uncharacterized protein n=1 Tax=Auriscalpium vulgare TaxID=40419 RepID=A0ACB8R7Y4_9AGAM|nr:hypothetical protein FA95DRAFT_1683907 [Auriscalpium vulgare]
MGLIVPENQALDGGGLQAFEDATGLNFDDINEQTLQEAAQYIQYYQSMEENQRMYEAYDNDTFPSLRLEGHATANQMHGIPGCPFAANVAALALQHAHEMPVINEFANAVPARHPGAYAAVHQRHDGLPTSPRQFPEDTLSHRTFAMRRVVEFPASPSLTHAKAGRVPSTPTKQVVRRGSSAAPLTPRKRAQPATDDGYDSDVVEIVKDRQPSKKNQYNRRKAFYYVMKEYQEFTGGAGDADDSDGDNDDVTSDDYIAKRLAALNKPRKSEAAKGLTVAIIKQWLTNDWYDEFHARLSGNSTLDRKADQHAGALSDLGDESDASNTSVCRRRHTTSPAPGPSTSRHLVIAQKFTKKKDTVDIADTVDALLSDSTTPSNPLVDAAPDVDEGGENDWETECSPSVSEGVLEDVSEGGQMDWRTTSSGNDSVTDGSVYLQDNETDRSSGSFSPSLPPDTDTELESATSVSSSLSDATTNIDSDTVTSRVGLPPRNILDRWGSIANLDDIDSTDLEGATVVGFTNGVQLVPHQIAGREWMRRQEENVERAGGILADGMGLGKTIQVLSRIVDDRRLNDGMTGPTLVVCASGDLVVQWEAEITRFTNGIRVYKHMGPGRTESSLVLNNFDIVLSSYHIVLSEHKNFTNSKARVAKLMALYHLTWRRVVLDEAHIIKEHTNVTSEACFALQSTYRWCLTGTPIQNSVKDLYSYIRFLRIPPFSSWQSFQEHIMQRTDRRGHNPSSMALGKLHAVLSTMMLRRPKTAITLPDRRVHVELCYFSDAERKYYTQLAKALKQRVETALDSSGKHEGVLVSLIRLRQACAHLSIRASEFPNIHGEFGEKVSEDGSLIPVNSVNASSPKLRRLAQLLRTIQQRPWTLMRRTHKAVIFCQFDPMLDLIERQLKEENMTYVRCDGSMSVAQRKESLRKFRALPHVLCLVMSFRVGSLGLNLTACSNVILMDPWWNPALEEQAFDRVHRIGQTEDVDIYRLIVDRSIEQSILNLQAAKIRVADQALSDDIMKKWSRKEILGFFRAA